MYDEAVFYGIVGHLRTIMVVVWATIMTSLTNSAGALFALVLLALMNGFIGWRSNWVEKRERFRFSKFWNAFTQLMFYMVFVVLVHLVFYLLGEQEWAKTAVSIVCYVALWAYVVKILQNSKIIFPNSRGIAFMYALVAIKFMPMLLGKLGFNITEEDMNKMSEKGGKDV